MPEGTVLYIFDQGGKSISQAIFAAVARRAVKTSF